MRGLYCLPRGSWVHMSTSSRRGHSRTRRAIAVVAIVVAGVASTAPAYAATRSWNSKSKPLTTRNGNGKALAQGYGTWKVGTTSSGTRSQTYGYLRDADSGNGYKVYFEMETYVNSGYCLQPQFTSCSGKYYKLANQFSNFNKETWGSGSWSPRFYASTKLDPVADYARAALHTAESNKGPDSKSGKFFTKGNKY